MIGFQVPPLFGSVSGLDIPAGEKLRADQQLYHAGGH